MERKTIICRLINNENHPCSLAIEFRLSLWACLFWISERLHNRCILLFSLQWEFLMSAVASYELLVIDLSSDWTFRSRGFHHFHSLILFWQSRVTVGLVEPLNVPQPSARKSLLCTSIIYPPLVSSHCRCLCLMRSPSIAVISQNRLVIVCVYVCLVVFSMCLCVCDDRLDHCMV